MKTTLYIVDHSLKKQMLTSVNQLVNHKYMTMDELKKAYVFDYDDEAIYHIMKTRNVKYDIAKNYIENMYFLWNTDCIDDPKIIELKEMYEELKQHKLLIQNPFFFAYLKQVNVVIKGYILNKYEMKIIDSIKEITSVIIEPIVLNTYEPTVYACNTIEQEVVFVASLILEQLKTTDIHHIKIALQGEYEYMVRFIFHMFHIPLDMKSTSILYGNIICKEWITLLKETRNIEKTYDEMLAKYGDIEPITTLTELTNTLLESEVTDTYIDYFITKCKTQTMKFANNRGIECISFKHANITDEDFVYILGCNRENMPKVYKDEEYLSDKLRDMLKVDTSLDKNKLEVMHWKEKIQATKHLIMTFKRKTAFESYMASPLVEAYSIKEVDKEFYTYSNIYNQLCLARKLDNLIKYNQKDSSMSKLYHTYPDIPYRVYDNRFTGISSSKIESFLNGKVRLSYSSMNNYYLCAFKYYIANVLNLDIYEENFTTEVGNLYHYVLSKSVEDTFDFKKEYETYIEKKEWTEKERFFLEKLEEELRFVIETLAYQNRFTTFKEALCEEKMYTNPSSKIAFTGIIDKIMYKREDNETLVSIVDYKTGTPEVNIMNIPYGLEMQLPIYVYLLKHNPQFRESKIVGFYLQKILNKDFSYDGEDYIREKRRLLRLDGYSTSDESLLEQFDTTYKDSELINGMKVGKNGFYSYAKTLTSSQIDKMSECVEEKIKEAGSNILNGQFSINPKRLDGELVGCKYCKFKDICYKTEKDIVNLEKIQNLDFLGGE